MNVDKIVYDLCELISKDIKIIEESLGYWKNKEDLRGDGTPEPNSEKFQNATK